MANSAKVRLYYTWLDSDISESHIERWLSEVSTEKQAVINRLVRKNDRLNSLLGLRLLRMGALDLGFTEFKLAQVIYEKGRKPRVNANIAFNISHSKDLVVTAITNDCEVGVDAEKIKPLDRTDYNSVMHEHELEAIGKHHATFFKLWSRKEAIVKAADGDGLPRMIDVKLSDESGMLDNRLWYLHDIDVHESYSVSLATSKVITHLETRYYRLDEVS